MDFSLPRFLIYVPDHDENEPVVAASPAAPPPPYSLIWYHGSRVCLPPVYMTIIHSKNVLPPPLLGEILAWVSQTESSLDSHDESPGVHRLNLNTPLTRRHE